MYSKYREITSERNVNQNFASGTINFRFQGDSNRTFNPYKSFFKFHMRFEKGDATPVDKDFGLGPNYYVCDNLFQQMRMKMNGKTICGYNDYVAQCSTLRQRMFKSQNIKESMLSSTNYSQIYLDDRINDISSDGHMLNSLRYSDGVNSLTRAQTFNNTTIDEAADGLALGANDGIFTYIDAAGANLDLRDVFSVGDYVKITNPVGVNDSRSTTVHKVIASTLLSFTVLPIPSVAGLGNNVANHAIFNIRKVNKYKINSLQRNNVELIWKPCLPFWEIDDDLPMCQYLMEFQPFSSSVFQKYAVETLSNLEVNTAADAARFNVVIEHMSLYLYETYHPTPISGSKTYHMNEICCTGQNLTTQSLTSKVVSLNDNNHTIVCAYQDSEVGDNTTKSRSKFKALNDEEQNITRHYVKKGKRTLPDPLPNLDMSGNIQRLSQRYYENFGYSDTFHIAKTETLKEWLDAGLYFVYNFGKMSGVNSCDVYSQFSSLDTDSKPTLLVFDIYSKTVSINYSNGTVTDIVL